MLYCARFKIVHRIKMRFVSDLIVCMGKTCNEFDTGIP
jgi:hypothetical protein